VGTFFLNWINMYVYTYPLISLIRNVTLSEIRGRPMQKAMNKAILVPKIIKSVMGSPKALIEEKGLATTRQGMISLAREPAPDCMISVMHSYVGMNGANREIMISFLPM